MAFETVKSEISDGVATITLNRPESMNSMNALMRRELRAAISDADRDARVLVLTGAGRGFCAGQDLGDATSFDELDLERTLREEYEPLLMALRDCRVPTIAAVNGVAAGAGANFALSADIVIAARSASFLEAFARIGLIPDAGGTYLLPRLIGHARALGMSLLAEPIPAATAAEWGMIWEAVEDDALESRTQEIARRLASGPTAAYTLIKQAMRESSGNSYAEQLELEARLQGDAGRTRDFREGVLAFLQKRPAAFEGR